MPHLIGTIALMVFSLSQATETNPISKVLEMISDLQHRILSQGSEGQKAYDEYVAYCQERSKSITFGIKNGKADRDSLAATIEEETATMGTLTAKIEDLSSDISSDDTDLKAAASLREKEAANFADEEGELKDIMDSLEGAISHFTKNGHASFVQEKSANSVTEALGVMVDAMAMSAEDASRLTALVQERSLENAEESDSDADSDLELGAPAAATHESHTAGVVSTLEGLYERAQGQQSKVREAEAEAVKNYQMLRQSLTNEIHLSTQDMHAAKVGLAESQEKKSVAAGDLDITSRDLERDVTSKDALHHECMRAAQEFQGSVTARKDELKALAAAKKGIEENSGGAAEQTYMTQVSFAQVAAHTTSHAGSDTLRFRVVHMLRKLAKKTNAADLAQLASRMSSALQLGRGSGDPFEKARGLITDMISQLEADSDADSSHKVYCDKQMSESNAGKEDTSAELGSLTSKSNQKKARSVKLKEQIGTLHQELASLAKGKAEAAQIRQEGAAVFKKEKAEMQQGLTGIRLALKILREHYGKALDKEGGIMSLLEVVESDFTQGLAALSVDEETAIHYYNSETKRNFELETAAKEHDMDYKTKEYINLNKVVSELSSDISTVQSRLKAIFDFDKTIKKTCVSGPDTYDERKRRREEKLSGLREAMQSIEGTVLLELGSSHKLRGARHHAA